MLLSEAIENESKAQKSGLLGMLLSRLAASLLGSALADKGVIKASESTTWAGEEKLVKVRIYNAAKSFNYNEWK